MEATGTQKIMLLVLLMAATTVLPAQTPDTTAAPEEDYSAYDAVTFAGEGTKRYCGPKILDLSPQKLITVGYEYHSQHQYQVTAYDTYTPPPHTINHARGLRVAANVPIVSKNSLTIQLSFNYTNTIYSPSIVKHHPLLAATLQGLSSTGLGTTVFKPWDERHFALLQATIEENGNYMAPSFPQNLAPRTSAALLYGWKYHDRKMLALGLSRTYRGGQLAYVPVLLYNYTAPGRQWGLEALLPARMHLRKTFNARHLLLAGYELEGQTYTLTNAVPYTPTIALRRSELRMRLHYEQSLSGFIWLTLQAGLRYNVKFDYDTLSGSADFYRTGSSKQPYYATSRVTHPFYFQVGFHLVSP